MKLLDFISIIWAANSYVDAGTAYDLTFENLYAAADNKVLLEFLSSKDRTGFIRITLELDEKDRVNEALHYAASALEGNESRKAMVTNNPWCMVIAIALEAIQSNFPVQLPSTDFPGTSEPR